MGEIPEMMPSSLEFRGGGGGEEEEDERWLAPALCPYRFLETARERRM
jgi:hypothetical protein